MEVLVLILKNSDILFKYAQNVPEALHQAY